MATVNGTVLGTQVGQSNPNFNQGSASSGPSIAKNASYAAVNGQPAPDIAPGAPLSATSLVTPPQQASLPTAPVPQDFQSILNGIMGGATAGATGDTSGTSAATTDGFQSNMLARLSAMAAVQPVKTADIYEQERKAAGIDAKQQAVNDYSAQLNQITAKSQANQLAVTGQGRGIPEVIIGGQQAQIAKEAAIQALPVAAQLAAAQGNLQLAQDHLDTVFKLKAQDAQAQNDYQNRIITSIFDFADKQQQRKLDAAQHAADQNFTLTRDANSFTQNLASEALKRNDTASMAAFAKLTLPDQNSPTFKKDLIKYNADVSLIESTMKPDPAATLDAEYKRAQISNLYSEIKARALGASGKVDPATALAYAQQYASTGELTNIPKEYVGIATQAASELPKNNGAFVSTQTGVMPKDAKFVDANSALFDLTKKLDEAHDLFKVLQDTGQTGTGASLVSFGLPLTTIKNKLFPSTTLQAYDTLRGEVIDLLARARTGAAINANEEKLYASKMPTDLNKSFFLGPDGLNQIDNLKGSLGGKLDTNLQANQASIYGYSKVTMPNGQQYTVGDIIESNGQKGRINPNGSITLIPNTQ